MCLGKTAENSSAISSRGQKIQQSPYVYLQVFQTLILCQNKSGFFHRIQNSCKAQAKLSIPLQNLYQVMEFDLLSRDLGW